MHRSIRWSRVPRCGFVQFLLLFPLLWSVSHSWLHYFYLILMIALCRAWSLPFCSYVWMMTGCFNGISCSDFDCAEGLVKCPGTWECIDRDHLCDGYDDCEGAWDELHCSHQNNSLQGLILFTCKLLLLTKLSHNKIIKPQIDSFPTRKLYRKFIFEPNSVQRETDFYLFMESIDNYVPNWLTYYSLITDMNY